MLLWMRQSVIYEPALTTDRDDMPYAPRWLGVVVLAVWIAYAIDKARAGLLPEMLWACHIFTVATIVGLLTRSHSWAAAGFLFHAAAGMLGYGLDAVANWPTSVMSALSHLVPLGAGLLAVWGRIWPRWVYWANVTACAAILPITYLLTEPALNVNLVYAPWPPLARWFDSLALLWSYNLAVAAALMWAVDWLLRRRWPSHR